MPDQEPQPHGGASELATFGEELRREREIRGISLKEIADATKISRRFLDAIERNDHRTLPAPVFTRGFVREYSRYLGLNSEEMVTRYNQAAAGDDRIEKPPTIARYPEVPVKDIAPRPPRKRGIPPAWASVDTNALALLLIAAALAAVAWWAVKQRRMEPAERPSAGPVAAASPVKRAPVAAPVIPAAAVPEPAGLELTIHVVSNSWVTLEADGKTVVNEELVAGEARTLEASERFRFRTIGNAGGVSLTLNGTAIPPLGVDGDVVRDRVFDRASLEELRGPAGAPALEPATTPAESGTEPPVPR